MIITHDMDLADEADVVITIADGQASGRVVKGADGRRLRAARRAFAVVRLAAAARQNGLRRHAGIGGVLLTTAMLVIAVSVLDAIEGASISATRPDVVAVEARTPGGMAPQVVRRIEDRAGVASSRALVINTSVGASPGDAMTPPSSTASTSGWAGSSRTSRAISSPTTPSRRPAAST